MQRANLETMSGSRLWAFLMVCCMAFMLCGCPPLMRTPVPIPKVEYSFSGDVHGKNLVVFLPGRSSSYKDFEREGFIRDIKDRGLDIDVVSVDAHLGYYYKRTLLERLRDDIIVPAHDAGYAEIWIVGISMGGLGAMLYAEKYPDTITGLYIMAPFLGDEDVIEEIADADDLTSWSPPENLDIEEDYQRGIWNWLKRYPSGDPGLPELYLGYGLDDRFRESLELLARELPPEHVFTAPGGHDWDAWRVLWQQYLDSEAIQDL